VHDDLETVPGDGHIEREEMVAARHDGGSAAMTNRNNAEQGRPAPANGSDISRLRYGPQSVRRKRAEMHTFSYYRQLRVAAFYIKIDFRYLSGDDFTVPARAGHLPSLAKACGKAESDSIRCYNHGA
jgi:hypothetical protein